MHSITVQAFKWIEKTLNKNDSKDLEVGLEVLKVSL